MHYFLGESLEVNGDSHCNKSKKEQTQDFDSWPLSGTVKKKKSINTYEKRHKHSHRTSDTKQKEADADITKNISSQNAYDDAHIKEIEENFFRDDNEDTGTTGTSPSTFVADKETGTKMQTLVKQDVANKASPRLSKRKLPVGKGTVKSISILHTICSHSSLLLSCYLVCYFKNLYFMGSCEVNLLSYK